MHEEIEKAVLRAIETMHDRLGEQLTIDDLAQAAIFSKFHFSRVFQRVTGLSPGRFLSAVRLQEAKRLLAETSLPVTEISVRVGYSSVGTFSSRFKGSVGVSPTTYRQLGRVTPEVAQGQEDRKGASAAVCGSIWSPVKDRPVFAGLFPDRILQGRPVRCTVLAGPGPYTIKDVPLGAWHLLAHSTAADGTDVLPRHREEDLCFGSHGPIVIRPDTGTWTADVQLRPIRRLDPPVLLALRDLRELATADG
jgi:AraC-like DNA-binding protein